MYKVLAILMASVFAVTFLTQPFLGAGWFWDFGNALGFAAFAGLLFQMLPMSAQRDARHHIWMGYSVLGVTIIHGFWFLTGDPVVRVYLLPGGPLYMWLGLGSLSVMTMLILTARLPDRLRIFVRYRRFRITHQILAYIATIAAGFHILKSGFYLSGTLSKSAIVLIMLTACFVRLSLTRPRMSPIAVSFSYLAASFIAAGLFCIVRDVQP